MTCILRCEIANTTLREAHHPGFSGGSEEYCRSRLYLNVDSWNKGKSGLKLRKK